MYTMKEACKLVNMSYETLKFYCKSGLIPNLHRDERNRRLFDDRNIAWINSLNCLRACGMGIEEMRRYMELCMEGESTIPERQRILAEKTAYPRPTDGRNPTQHRLCGRQTNLLR